MKLYFKNFQSLIEIAIFLIFIIDYCGAEKKTNDIVVYVLKPQKTVYSLANLPNGYLATASDQGFIQIWNVEEGYLERTVKISADANMDNLVLLQNRFLAIIATEKTIQIWNADYGILHKSIHVSGNNKISSLATLKNGILVITMKDGIMVMNPLTEEIIKHWPNIKDTWMVVQ